MEILEEHPFEAFIPDNMKVLIIGSFPGRTQTVQPIDKEAWFYGAPRNQFWRILEIVYNQPLKTRKEKEMLFQKAGIGITDIIQSCIRKEGTNDDNNLEVRNYNTEIISRLLSDFQPRVLFTSRFVEKLFRKFFKDYPDTCTLPSPSPRYFRINIEEKAWIYKRILPEIK